MSRPLTVGTLLILVALPLLSWQDLAFEAASIHPNRSTVSSSAIFRDEGRLTFQNVSLRECIMFGYSIPTGRDYELSGPGWLDEERVDILATFPADATRDQLRIMTQALLRERFGLTLHRENRAVRVYALTLDKAGHKLKPSEITDGSFSFRSGSVSIRGFSMQGFADRLSGLSFRLDRPVVNQTELDGVFDFDLEWAASDAQSGPSIFTALREQLGLVLRPEEATMAVYIVDKMNRAPSEN